MFIEPELALALILVRGLAAAIILIWRVARRNDLIQSANSEDPPYMGSRFLNTIARNENYRIAT